MTRPPMHLTRELVDYCFRAEPDLGFDLKYEYWDRNDFEVAVTRLLSQRTEGPLWIFAYGSLIWRSEHQYAEQKRGTVHGWHRSFCMQLTRWRGTAEQPGLMMCLVRGGSCEGIAYRLSEEKCRDELFQLLWRELGCEEAFASVRWVKVRTETETLRALTFYARPDRMDTYIGKWPLEKVAHTLARACGHVGSGAEYLYQTVLKLEENGIHDRNLWRLQKLVASEIGVLRDRSDPQ